MKISKLNIEQYKHLENLEFDFTYQTGKRKGQPLNKICFIGQSATGKTNLLELINDSISDIICKKVYVDTNHILNESLVKLKAEYEFIIDSKTVSYKNDIFNYNEEKFIRNSNRKFHHQDEIYNIIPKTNIPLYIKSNILSQNNIEIFTKNPLDLLEKYPISESFSNNIKNITPTLFDDKVKPDLWIFLLGEILDYRKKVTQKLSELFHKGLLSDNKDKLNSEFTKWQKDNPNKLEEFANKFNPIIKKLNLEIDLVNTEYSIPISNKNNDVIIPIQDTSTGTKSLLLTFLPLFKLDTKDTIVLMDEPERSLYPDMQMDLIEHYQNLAPDAQFIVATHSPFIAASFEPEERFILYFDDEGKVAVRRGSSPIGDDPNDMLKNDFGVNYYNKHGEDAYKKYLSLKQAIAIEKDPVKKKELLLERVKLGDAYNF